MTAPTILRLAGARVAGRRGDWFDHADAAERIRVAEIAMLPAAPAHEGVHPQADLETRLRIGRKRRADMLDARPCPLGVWIFGPPRSVRSRLPIWG